VSGKVEGTQGWFDAGSVSANCSVSHYLGAGESGADVGVEAEGGLTKMMSVHCSRTRHLNQDKPNRVDRNANRREEERELTRLSHPTRIKKRFPPNKHDTEGFTGESPLGFFPNAS
jgi:hypothetical protein